MPYTYLGTPYTTPQGGVQTLSLVSGGYNCFQGVNIPPMGLHKPLYWPMAAKKYKPIDVLNLLDGINIPYLIGTSKQWFTSMHFNQYASKTPHVDGEVIRQTKKNLRRSVKSALDILVNLSALTVTTQYCAMHPLTEQITPLHLKHITFFYNFTMRQSVTDWSLQLCEDLNECICITMHAVRRQFSAALSMIMT